MISTLVSGEVVEALEQAIDRGDTSGFVLEGDEGRYTVNLDRVVYLKRHARESRVGFGA